jgi:hypothetical protein
MVPRFWMPIPLGRRFSMHFMIKKLFQLSLLIRGLLLLQTSWLGQNFGCRIPSKSQLPTDFEALFVTWSHIFVYHLYPLVNVYITMENHHANR